MAAEWYYQNRGRQAGPVDSGELRRLAETGIVRPEMLVRQGDSGRWVRAEQVRGLFQGFTPALGATPPEPPPLPPPVARLSTSSGESPIRHGLGAAAVNEASAKPKRVWPVTWAAIIAGSGTALLLLLWGLAFRGGSTPQQPAEKDQPLLAAAQSAESRASARGPQAVSQQAEKDQPPLAAAQSAEPRSPAPAPQPLAPPQQQPAAPPPPAKRRVKFQGAIYNFPADFTDAQVGKALEEHVAKTQMDHFAGKSDRMSPAKAPPAAGVLSPPGAVLELADLAELVGPSVVQVNVTGPEEVATGSGFVLDKQGTIVTNYHVIEDATAGRIVFSDRTSAPITGYLGVWPEKDIALVRVECPPEKLHPLRLATSAPRQGERVAAFGSPLGLQQSMSEGIVSAVRESKELRALGPINVNARLIQTTTPISHGNSGGPLVDMKGMVVGVNTLTFRPLGGENVNFAVAAVELPPLLLAKNETPSPLPASDPAAGGVRRILSRARAHMDAGDDDSAIADFTEAIRLDPETADAYFWRGLAYLRKNDYDRAIADATEVIRLDPKKRAGAYSWRGEAYRSKRDYDRAIADYSEAIRLDPTYAMAYSWRGLAYLSKDDYDSGIGDFTQAIRLEPKNARAYYERGRAYFEKHDYGRGLAYDAKRDYESAIADFTEVIQLDATNAGAYYGRARAYFAKDDDDSAIADFTEAIRLDLKITGARNGRGFAYGRKGDYDSAIADFTEAIRLDPTDPVAYYGRGLAYRSKGQRAAAERDFAHAKRLGHKLQPSVATVDGGAELDAELGARSQGTVDWGALLDAELGRRKPVRRAPVLPQPERPPVRPRK